MIKVLLIRLLKALNAKVVSVLCMLTATLLGRILISSSTGNSSNVNDAHSEQLLKISNVIYAFKQMACLSSYLIRNGFIRYVLHGTKRSTLKKIVSWWRLWGRYRIKVSYNLTNVSSANPRSIPESNVNSKDAQKPFISAALLAQSKISY